MESVRVAARVFVKFPDSSSGRGRQGLAEVLPPSGAAALERPQALVPLGEPTNCKHLEPSAFRHWEDASGWVLRYSCWLMTGAVGAFIFVVSRLSQPSYEKQWKAERFLCQWKE